MTHSLAYLKKAREGLLQRFENTFGPALTIALWGEQTTNYYKTVELVDSFLSQRPNLNDLTLAELNSWQKLIESNILSKPSNPNSSVLGFYRDITGLLEYRKINLPPDSFYFSFNNLDNHILQLTQEQSKYILEHTGIEGRRIINGKPLTIEHLEKNGLSPKFQLKVGKKRVWVSNFFEFRPCIDSDKNKKLSVVVYIQNADGEFCPRIFYLSDSQGIFRYLPSLTHLQHGDKLEILHLSKGYDESTLDGHYELQKQLAKLSDDPNNIVDICESPSIFVGASGSPELSTGENVKSTYRIEVEPKPKIKMFNDTSSLTEINFQKNPDLKPNFERMVTSYNLQTALYGEITVEIYFSKNESLVYFFGTSRDMSWVVSIQENKEINSLGIHNSWINMKKLTVPPFEYMNNLDTEIQSQAVQQIPNTHYVNIYDIYDMHIPLIQEYRAKKGFTTPHSHT